jgi:hypothetical protein
MMGNDTWCFDMSGNLCHPANSVVSSQSARDNSLSIDAILQRHDRCIRRQCWAERLERFLQPPHLGAEENDIVWLGYTGLIVKRRFGNIEIAQWGENSQPIGFKCRLLPPPNGEGNLVPGCGQAATEIATNATSPNDQYLHFLNSFPR